jgi:hypothetical protein
LAGFGGSLREKMLRDAKSLKREALQPDRGTPAFAQGFGAVGTDFTKGDCRGSRVGCFEVDARDAGGHSTSLRALPLQDYLSVSESTILDTNFTNPHELDRTLL